MNSVRKRAAIFIIFILSFALAKNIFAEETQINATDTQSSAKKTDTAPKYSKFFDEKKEWCEALVITCTDFRFATATQEFINDRLGLQGKYDYISIPGSIRNLLDSKTRDLVLNEFGVSVRLHHVNRIIIIGHQDCSIGYGGTKNFPEPLAEYNTICGDLKKARRLMRFKFPHLKVYLFYSTASYSEHQRIYNFKQIL
jgi:hypothetical protein